MKILAKIHSKINIDISSLLKRKAVSEYFLLEKKYVTHSRAFEVWWYSYKEKNHVLIKHISPPYYLFFILLEEKKRDIFTLEDFDYYLNNGKFKDGGVWTFGDISKK